MFSWLRYGKGRKLVCSLGSDERRRHPVCLCVLFYCSIPQPDAKLPPNIKTVISNDQFCEELSKS